MLIYHAFISIMSDPKSDQCSDLVNFQILFIRWTTRAHLVHDECTCYIRECRRQYVFIVRTSHPPVWSQKRIDIEILSFSHLFWLFAFLFQACIKQVTLVSLRCYLYQHDILLRFILFLPPFKSHQPGFAVMLVGLIILFVPELLFEVDDGFMEGLMFAKEFVALGATLDGISALDEPGHLFEKLIFPTCCRSYFSFNFECSWSRLNQKNTMDLIYSSCDQWPLFQTALALNGLYCLSGGWRLSCYERGCSSYLMAQDYIGLYYVALVRIKMANLQIIVTIQISSYLRLFSILQLLWFEHIGSVVNRTTFYDAVWVGDLIRTTKFYA